MKVTKKDLQIFSRLRKDSREMLTKLSRKTGIPVSTIFDRLKYHKDGLIKKNTILLDFSLLGFNSKAKVILKVDREDRASIKNLLRVHRNVNSLQRINNGYDFLFEAIFRNMKDLEDFITSLEEKFKILEKHVYYIIDDIKEEEFLSREDTHELVIRQ